MPTYFSDADFANITPDRLSMHCNVGTLNGFITFWYANIERSIAKYSTDVEIKAIFSTVHRLISSLPHFLASGAFHQLFDYSLTLYIDSQAAVKVITANKVASRTRYNDVAVNFPIEYI